MYKFDENVKFNLMMLQGIDLENGFLVKYYADNNFIGQRTKYGKLVPQFSETKRTLEFKRQTVRELQDFWTRSFVQYKTFSIKTTCLLKFPDSGSYKLSIDFTRAGK